MKRALALRHHLEDHPGLVGEAFAKRGYDVDVAMIDESQRAPSLEGYDTLIILGSKSAVYDVEQQSGWFRHELALIAEADARGVPILGICFGAQALCHFFGGTVRRAEHDEIGWFEIDVRDGVELSTGPWLEFHFDECVVPDVAEVWATTPHAVQAFVVGPHLAVQFHPEVDDVQLKDWLSADEDEVRDFGVDVDALIARTAAETPAARDRAQELVDLFLSRAG
jgi:GMP synthase-like glutamine amidotransferase